MPVAPLFPQAGEEDCGAVSEADDTRTGILERAQFLNHVRNALRLFFIALFPKRSDERFADIHQTSELGFGVP